MFNAKTTILASGGAGQAYEPTTNGLIVTGDGIAQAYRIGARLMDMEMVQYHPTTLAGNGILITEGARGEGAWLLNAKGERFMEKYAPNKLELASRDVVSRAEQTEINEGRGFPDGTVALDITKVPRRRTLEALREIVNIGRDFAGVDITREPIHIRPGQHYMMGGVKTDVRRADDDPRAVRRRRGRVRLGPRRQPPRRQLAARHADLRPARGRARRQRARRCRCRRPPPPASTDTERRIRGDHRPRARWPPSRAIKEELGETMNEYVAVFRDADGSAEGPRDRSAGSRRRRRRRRSTTAARVFNQDVIGAIELGYMLDCRRDDRGRARRSARSPAARSSAPTSPSATTTSGSSTSTSRVNGDDVPNGQLLAGHDHQLAAPGKDVLAQCLNTR